MWRSAWVLAAIAVAGGAFLMLSDEADASHFWAGSLEWEPIIPAAGVDPVVGVTGYLSFDPTFCPLVLCNGIPPCDVYAVGQVIPATSGSNYAAGYNWWGDLFLQPGNQVIPFSLQIQYIDYDHCRFAGRIVQPGSPGDPKTYGLPAGEPTPVIVPVNPVGTTYVEWRLSARSDGPHKNNPNIDAHMESEVSVRLGNRPPVINFPSLSVLTDHGPKGYGNHHCESGIICQFYVYASDPDGDAISYRLATGPEAGGPFTPYFKQPVGMTIDSQTGLVRWPTTGFTKGSLYSVQVIVEDNHTQVPIDFMVEIGDPVDGCPPDNSPPEVDPETGETFCRPPNEPTCENGGIQGPECDNREPRDWLPAAPDGPFAEPGVEYWPMPPDGIDPGRAISNGEYGAGRSLDSRDPALARMDSDGDGMSDADDLCPNDPKSGKKDLDKDRIGDGCDDDLDGDGIINELDACPEDANPECMAMPDSEQGIVVGAPESRGYQSSLTYADDRAIVTAEPTSEASSLPTAHWLVLGAVAGLILLLTLGAAARRR